MTTSSFPSLRDFSIEGARRCADAGCIEEWVHTYLNTGNWSNKPLSDGLKLKERFWLGPIEVHIDNIDRLCGPEEHMDYWEPQEQWDRRLRDIEASLDDVMDLPPLIVNTVNGTLRNSDGSYRFVLADGSHRLEVLRSLGEVQCFVLIWFETEAHRIEYLAEREQLGLD